MFIQTRMVKMYCDNILCAKVQNVCKLKKITYFGLGNRVSDDILQKLQLSESSAKVYYKMVKDGCLYESSLIIKKRSNNSFALLRNNKFVQIVSFIIDEET